MATGAQTAALIGLLGGLGEGIGQAGQTIAQGQAGFGRRSQDRLKELQRMEELKALGLSEEEIQTLQRATLDPLRAQQQQRLEQQQALLGATELAGSGQALATMRDMQEKEDRAISDANKAVALADMKERRVQEAEMRKLEQAADVADAAPGLALAQLFGNTAAMGAGAYLKQAALEETMGKREQGATGGQNTGGEDDADLLDILGGF
jgi:hypothetical protein